MHRLHRLPRLHAPKDPLDALEPEAPLRGGIEVVVLSMTEICEAIEAIYRIAMTVRLFPEPSDFAAATEELRAELGIGTTAMRMRLRPHGDHGRDVGACPNRHVAAPLRSAAAQGRHSGRRSGDSAR